MTPRQIAAIGAGLARARVFTGPNSVAITREILEEADEAYALLCVETSSAPPTTGHDSHKAMFTAAVSSLAAISNALEIPEDEAQAANGEELILEAIDKLKLCPRCDANGYIEVMSDGGPDAYEVQVDCPHCNGQQTLAAAYDGVLKLLKREEEKYREAAAVVFFTPGSKDAAGKLQQLADYAETASQPWLRDRLLALVDMAKVAK